MPTICTITSLVCVLLVDQTFYISNDEIYVEPTPVEPEEPTPPIPERELTEEEKAALKEQEFLNAKSYKIDEMSKVCEKAIENGVIVGGKAYSYTVQDQSNMLSIVNMARETGMEVPYHANGEAVLCMITLLLLKFTWKNR